MDSTKRDFMHLPLSSKIEGKPYYKSGGQPSKTTAVNRVNRVSHGTKLKKAASSLSQFWQNRQNDRQQQNLPTIECGVPLILEIDPNVDVGFLRGLGFEVVCDIEEGFIIVSTEKTDLSTFVAKVDKFITDVDGKKRSGSPAQVYALHAIDSDLSKILSEDLHQKWATLGDTTTYTVDISVSCSGNITLPSKPKREDNMSDEQYRIKLSKWEENFLEQYNKWDELKIEREGSIERIINEYNGTVIQCVDGVSSISLPDSFSIRISINGAGLRDIVLNYPHIFEVDECVTIETNVSVDSREISGDLRITKPNDDSPIVCVIDSGIQENHKYLQPAILHDESISLLPTTTNVSDEVAGGGHGTRVAGATLFPFGVPKSGDYQLPCFIRNIRVVNAKNQMPKEIIPGAEIEVAVNTFAVDNILKTKIFNHSVGEGKSFCGLVHMSKWAAKIDDVSYDYDVLFVQSAGNIRENVIKTHIDLGFPYPLYFGKELTRIANPAQSLQALTVGSISHSDFENDDVITMGKKGEISALSRIGAGIWDSVKPDVVEYGGTYAINKSGEQINLTTPEDVCPELIRRSPEGSAFSRDDIGTSFAAPKVTHIAAEIQKIYPDSSPLLYRALIAQSARWSVTNWGNELTSEEQLNALRYFGYGLPNVERATQNNEYRVTLVTTEPLEVGESEAHIYQINIPDELRNIGEDYNILLEITLSYSAKPRQTRRYIRGYLSTWLDWVCSNKGETLENFTQRVIKTGEHIDDGDFDWTLHTQSNRGTVKKYSRQRQTLQKDWCVVKSSQLDETFCVAVRGHKGWGGLFKAKYALAVSFEAIDQNIEIYENIRLSNLEVETDVGNQEIDVELDYETNDELGKLKSDNEGGNFHEF